MDFEGKYSTRSPAVKRLMREAMELSEPTEDYFAQPLEDNLFEWHFTVRGPPDSEFEGGFYHGRIILPPEYPMKPPNIIVLTPNGRFEINTKICLSISGHHPESWQPSWSIRTALLAIIGFMPTPGRGTVGSMDYTPEERKLLAKKSHKWKCPACGQIKDQLLMPGLKGLDKGVHKEARMLVSQIDMKGESVAPRTQTTLRALSGTELRAIGNMPSQPPAVEAERSISRRIETMEREYSNNPASTTSNVFICLIVVAIAMLLYRRVFLLQEVERDM